MRKFIRHPSEVPIECWQLATGRHLHRPMRNIGRGGLCFQSVEPMAPNTPIGIRIPVVNPPVEAEATVVWCRPVDGQYEVGVRFAADVDLFSVRMVEQVCHIEEYRRRVGREEGRRISSEQAAEEWIERYASDFPAA